MATAYPSCHFAKEGETPWTKTDNHTHIHIPRPPVHVMCCGRKPACQERIHAVHKESMQTPHKLRKSLFKGKHTLKTS